MKLKTLNQPKRNGLERCGLRKFLPESFGFLEIPIKICNIHEDDIQNFIRVLRTTENMFKMYHEVWYEKKSLSRVSVIQESDSIFQPDKNGNMTETRGLIVDVESKEDEIIRLNEEDLKSQGSNSSSELDVEFQETEEHCGLCRLITSKVVGPKPEHEKIDKDELSEKLSNKLVGIVN